jgi:ferredoxin
MPELAEPTVEETCACEAAEAAPAVCGNGEPCRIEPDLRFKMELAEFGGDTFNKCYQCATCSGECPLSPDEHPFPRKEMIWINWGLKDRLIRDPDIWACHYCGDCSARCPRAANPGELMAALRRYAISRYDWTGLSRRLYTSRAWEIGAILFVALIVVGLFVFSGAFTPQRMNTAEVHVSQFIPVRWVHYGDWVMAGILTFFLLTNSLRMCRFILKGQKIPISVFISECKTFLVQFTTQKRWRECSENRTRWARHLMLVIGYATMFLLVMFFLHYLQVDDSRFSWVSLLGYYATFAILYFSGDALISRLRKREEMHKHSHDSDWMFLILLFLTGLTGILMHLSRLLDLPLPTYFMYVIHLAVAVPMLVVEVPFGKWSHLMYRPLALYLTAVKEKARELEVS